MIIQHKGDVIKLKGSLTENQWPAIRSLVSLLITKHPQGVVIDASGLTDVTETGARTFIDASNFIQAHKARVVVAAMPEEMLKSIRGIPGLRSQLVVAANVEDARASLESIGSQVLQAKKKRPAVLVPLIGSWRKAIQFAAPQAISRRAEIYLLYVLQIPRNQPIGVPVPEMENEAHQLLTEAEKLAKQLGVKAQKLTTRARDITEGAAKFASETYPELVVLAYSKADVADEGGRCAVLGAFCHEVGGDVALYCASE